MAVTHAQEAEKAQAQPVDSCSFPPGMLPALCRRKRETGGHPYEPLSAVDLESMGECVCARTRVAHAAFQEHGLMYDPER